MFPLAKGEQRSCVMQPAKGFDVGAGRGKPVTATVSGGEVGIIVDTRGRPLKIQTDKAEKIQKQKEWLEAMGIPF